MISDKEWYERLQGGVYDEPLLQLYGAQRLADQRRRYCAAVRAFRAYYGPVQGLQLFSVPGRTELCGNNTDLQGGVALAAAVDRDIIAVAAPNDSGIIRVKSYGFDKLDVVDLAVTAPQEAESTHSASLIRGIARALEQRGGQVGGFDAYTTSEVLRGSGLSSSAAFEVMIGTLFNAFYNEERFSPLEIAQIGQYAENTYFGKPSGLLDPLTCAVGGVICVDLASEKEPVIQYFEGELTGTEYVMCITDTRGSHSEMMQEFAAVRKEMERVARELGVDRLCDADQMAFWACLPQLRASCGDRAVLRAVHFFQESARAGAAYNCLQTGDSAGFIDCIRDSGSSAVRYNQNAVCCGFTQQQEVPLALALSQHALQGRGASRLQGTGFAGTIQAFVPQEQIGQYTAMMESVFQAGCCHVMRVRRQGAIRIL